MGKILCFNDIYRKNISQIKMTMLPVPLSVAPMGNETQIFAKVGDGHLQQRKPAKRFKKKNPNLGKSHFSTHQLEVKYVVGKQISAQKR